MIKEHAFNAAWTGARAGVSFDAKILTLGAKDLAARLEPFDWIELRADCRDVPDFAAANRAGFFQVDVLLHFRLRLPPVGSELSGEALDVRWANETPFGIASQDIANFSAERFRHLPGIDAGKLSERYSRWGNELIAKQPEWCLEVWHEGQLQGWFLGAMDEAHGLSLTLAMLSSKAQVSGALLYQTALRAFAGRGAKIGQAAFSASNVSVLNLYAALGARFTKAEGCWFWINPSWHAQTRSQPAAA